MTLKTRSLPPTAATIQVPSILCSGVGFTGLTAPTLRAAIVLVSSASPGGRIDMLKPKLEQLSGTRIDNGTRFLARPAASTIDVGGDAGEAWFEELDYTPGEQKRLAGLVIGQVTRAARDVLAHPAYARRVPIAAAVLGRLTTVGGILLYLRLADELARQSDATQITLRLDLDDARHLFGSYVNDATLSRIGRVLVEPAVADIASALPDFLVTAEAVVPAVRRQGRAWSHIQIVATRTVKRTIRQLMVEFADRDEYDRTKHQARGSLKSKAAPPDAGNV